MTIFNDYSNKALTLSRFRGLGVKNFAKKAAFTFLTIGAGLGFFGSDEVKAQSNLNLKQTVEADTLWANGIYTAIDKVSGNTIPDVTITSYAIAMDMVIDPTRRQEVTDNNGAAPFEKYPIYIDSTVSINELLKQSSQIIPTIGSEINAFFPDVLSGTIELYDLKGNLVEKQKFNSDHAYVNLSKLATGMHIYKIKTPQGIEFSDKFMKSGDRINGPANRPNTNLKGSKYIEEATYTVVWEKEGSILKDSTNITLYEGNNGFINLLIQPIAGIPQHQDFTGTVRDGSNNNIPIANTLVTLEDVISGDTLWMFTGSDGTFSFNNLNLGQGYIFNVGNITGKQSHEGSYCSTPIEITVASDTAINLTDVFLLDLDGLSTDHIGDQNKDGTRQGPIEYNLSGFNETQKAWLRNSFVQLQADEDDAYTFIESSVPLVGTGINITPGAYYTTAIPEEINTPFGILFPTLYADITMGTENYPGFVHEIKRALGINEVSWESVMKTPAIIYSTEDKDIGKFMRTYWDAHYNDNLTKLDLNTITDTIPIPAAARAYKNNGSKGKFNNYNNNLPTSKYMNN